MKIASRLLLGFGVLMVVICALSLFTSYSARQTRSAYDAVLRLRDNEALDQRIAVFLLQGRLALWKAIATDEAAPRAAAEKAFAQAAEQIESLRAATLDPARREAVVSLATELGVYRSRMAKVLTFHGADGAVLAPEGRRAIDDLNDTGARLAGIADPLATAYSGAAAQAGEAAAEGLHLTIVIGLIAGVASVLLGLVFSSLVARSITNPVRAMTGAMRKLADGDLSIRVPDGQRHELGAMAEALETFHQAALDNLRLREAQVRSQAEAEELKRAALRAMADRIEQEAGAAVEQVRTLCGDMARTAGRMASTAARGEQSAAAAADSAQHTLGTAQTVARAAELLTASIVEINRQVTTSGNVSRDAVAAAEGARKSIESLSRQASEIGQIAEIIAGIAARTNLLALNATIEAARAGEAGRGFAVVASEVKSLANQTARSTEQIGEQIVAVRDATHAAAEAVARIVQTIDAVERIASAIAESVDQQGNATAEIASSIAETADGVRQIAGRSGDVRGAAAETDQQANEVRQGAELLEGAVRALSKSVNHVVRTSTEDVNRRLSDRIAIDVAGRLWIAGQADVAVRVCDVSLGGARVQGIRDVPTGSSGRLEIEGRALAVTCCATPDPDTVGVAFATDAATSAVVTSLLTRFDQDRRAA